MTYNRRMLPIALGLSLMNTPPPRRAEVAGVPVEANPAPSSQDIQHEIRERTRKENTRRENVRPAPDPKQPGTARFHRIALARSDEDIAERLGKQQAKLARRAARAKVQS